MGDDPRREMRICFLFLFLFIFSTHVYCEKIVEAKSWKPKIFIYQEPAPEKSDQSLYTGVDPQIIQKLIDLLEEEKLGVEETGEDSPSLRKVRTLVTPEGLELKNRYTRLGVALSEALGWEDIKRIRVISEQNLKQRLTTVARWDTTPTVRAIALIALASVKEKSDLVYFQEALWSRDIGIRFAAIEALGRWKLEGAVEALRTLAEKDDSLLIRVTATSALLQLGESNALQGLRNFLDHSDWLVRSLAAKGIGEWGNYEDYDLLLSRLSREQIQTSNEFVVSELSIAALKLFPLKLQKIKEEEERKKEEKLRKKKGLPPLPKIEKPILRAKTPAYELEPLVVTAPRLKLPARELGDARINFQLLNIIQNLQDKEDVRISKELVEKSLTHEELNKLVTPMGIRLRARYNILGFLLTEGLAGTKDLGILQQLVRMAREAKSPNIRSFALGALAYSRDRNHLYLFQEALKSPEFQDRFAALEALEIWGYEDAIPTLIGVYKLESEPVLKVYAAQAILRLGNPLGKDFLIQSLDENDWVPKAMAFRYLGEMGNSNDFYKILSYLGGQYKTFVQAELTSSLLRLYPKKVEEDTQ